MGGEWGIDRVFRLVRRDPLSESARRNSAQEREKHGDHQKSPAGAHGQRIPACRSAAGVKFAGVSFWLKSCMALSLFSPMARYRPA